MSHILLDEYVFKNDEISGISVALSILFYKIKAFNRLKVPNQQYNNQKR